MVIALEVFPKKEIESAHQILKGTAPWSGRLSTQWTVWGFSSSSCKFLQSFLIGVILCLRLESDQFNESSVRELIDLLHDSRDNYCLHDFVSYFQPDRTPCLVFDPLTLHYQITSCFSIVPHTHHFSRPLPSNELVFITQDSFFLSMLSNDLATQRQSCDFPWSLDFFSVFFSFLLRHLCPSPPLRLDLWYGLLDRYAFLGRFDHHFFFRGLSLPLSKTSTSTSTSKLPE